jgi:hypothetical protein
MTRRALIPALSAVALILLPGGAAAQRLEQIAWADTGRATISVAITDPTAPLDFQLSPFLSFHVPASKASQALFFDCWGQVLYRWSTYQEHRVSATPVLRLRSNEIPANIDIYSAFGVMTVGESNNAADQSLAPSRQARYMRFILRRDQVDWWYVVDKTTGAQVPDAVAVPILDALMDDGFDVEVSAIGTVRGVSSLQFFPVTIGVQRELVGAPAAAGR